MKAGSRLKSAVCETEIIVIKAAVDATVFCGGMPMVEERSSETKAIDPRFAMGTTLGKRYVDPAGTLELLCIKQGKGSLALDGVVLQIKAPKPLPSSD
jgi:hypothetical protein